MSDDSYKRLYPAQEALTFDGGYDSKFQKALIPENESPDCLNVEFGDGSVATRQGSVLVNTAPAGAVAFDGLYTRRDNSGAETMLAFIGGHMLALGATTFVTVPSAQSVFTIGSRVGAEMAENYLFMGNGGVTPYKWDGSVFTTHGISAPTQTATVVSATTGSLTTGASYVYCYTNVNTALVESDISPLITFVVTTAGNGLAATISSIASGTTLPSQGVNARYLYRSKANAPLAYFRVTKLSDTSTNSFTDTLADASLGVQSPTDQGVPPKYNAIIFLNGILFVNDVNNPNYVWYTPAGTPYSFPSTNFFKVGDKTGDLVKGFGIYDNNLVVFAEKSTWINYMPNAADATTWRRIRSNSPYGCKSPYAPVSCNLRDENLLLHPVVQSGNFVGFAALTGTTLDPSVSIQPVTAAGSDLQSNVIEPDMFLVQRSYVQNISGITYKNRAFLSVTWGANQTTNNRIYVWDFSITNVGKNQPATWAPWSGTGLSVAQFTIYNGKLYGADAGTSGFVYQLGDTGVYNDAGAAINSYYWTKEYSGFPEDQSQTKDFRYINMLVDNAGSYSMNLVYRTNSDSGGGTTQALSLATSAPTWNGTTWNGSIWSAGIAQSDQRVYLGPGISGKRIQFRFDNQNTANQRFRVHRAQFFYNNRGYR